MTTHINQIFQFYKLKVHKERASEFQDDLLNRYLKLNIRVVFR